MLTRLRLIVPGLAAALMCIAGCGSSKSSSSTTRSSSASTAAATTTTTVPATKSKQGRNRKRAAVPGRTYRVRLRGTSETPAGAPKGTGHAVVTLRGKKLEVCWTFRGLKGFDKPTAAHIHVGLRGTSGNIIVPLSTGATFRPKGCVPATATVIRAVAKHPRGYYVNIHSKKYPAGAVRAQL